MARIDFEAVDLVYPVCENRGLTLKDLIFHGLLRRQRPRLWTAVHALRGVSFHVGDGERVGVIGRNGAGKSTLLRAVSGVYPVTAGRRSVSGTICSLFDLGLGFEPSASGWENLRLRAYLQGATPRDVRDRLRQVAGFTELGDALDLPLSCYSHGMIMRLAFAIATADDPEVLLIDEAFATGDLAFQRKADARMRECMGRARIVVMVGHQLDFLQEFCSRVLWLDRGRLRADGPPRRVIAEYRREVAPAGSPAPRLAVARDSG
jgi:ABC-type polysaccharide/polyol phosphate transport system ATPase subunit